MTDNSTFTEAKLICDASYNEEIFLGGYSGGYTIFDKEHGDWSYMYRGIVADAFNSNEAEMMAIADGARKLGQCLKTLGRTLNALEVITDSKTAIDQYTLFMNGGEFDPKYTKQMEAMHKHLTALGPNVSLKLQKVAAHVPDEVATPIEKFHDIIDKNALAVRWHAQNHVYKPKNGNSQFYAAVLPSSAHPRDDLAMRQLGFTYAMQGLIARIAFVGKVPAVLGDHPFIQGMNLAASKLGVAPNSLFRVQTWDREGGLVNGCEGLDRVLVRHHYSLQGGYSHHLNFMHAPFQFAGVATRAIYGPQSGDMQSDRFWNGRVEPASRFVVNLSAQNQRERRPTDVSEWMDTFMNYVRMPYFRGPKEALVHANTPDEWRQPDPDVKKRQLAMAFVNEHLEGLLPNQAHARLMNMCVHSKIKITQGASINLSNMIRKFKNHPGTDKAEIAESFAGEIIHGERLFHQEIFAKRKEQEARRLANRSELTSENSNSDKHGLNVRITG